MLPAKQRLCKNDQFRRIYQRGRSYPSDIAVLHVMRRVGEAAADCPNRRIGFVVSKKQGDAVTRNRIKRRLREAVRAQLSDLREGPYDLILVGRTQARTADWLQIRTALQELFQRASLLEMSHG